MMKIAVVIVNWNGKNDTLACLQSFYHTQYRFPIRLIVIDNASSDGSVAAIGGNFPDVKLIVNKHNLGFTGGNNQGIKFALKELAQFIFLVNNDTLFSAHTIEDLVHCFERRQNCSIAGPKIYFAPGYEFHKKRYKQSERGRVLWYAGGLIDWPNIRGYHRGVDEIDHGQYDHEEPTDFISGCAMMIKSEVFTRVGLFDERYYLYYEDLDFNIRVHKAGGSIYYVPSSILWHKNAGSSYSGSEIQDYFITRNRLLFGLQHAPWRAKIALLKESCRIIIQGRLWQRKGVVDAILGKWGKGSWSS